MGNVIIVNDREITFLPPTDAQVLVLSRILRSGKQLNPEDQEQVSLGLEQMSKILDIIDAMIESALDRDFLEQEMIRGTLDLEALMSGFQQAVAEKEDANRATSRAAKKATSSRARKK
jgi:cadmium resistance protein CadD (predicted permease)